MLDLSGFNDAELKIEVRAGISMHVIFDSRRGKLYIRTLYHKRKRGGGVQEGALLKLRDVYRRNRVSSD